MTPQELQRLARIEALLMALVKSDRYLLEKHLQIADGRNVQVGKTTGTMIGTEATQKLAFFGNTPIVQPVQIAAPTGGATIDQPARDIINVIILRLTQLGLAAA